MLTAVCFNGYFRIFLRKIRCWMECFVIFVMAWCWCNATESKPQNVKCNIFSELTLKASLLLFRLIISKNAAEKFCVISEIWTEPCRKTLCWKYVVETNLCAKNQVCVKMESWKRTLRLNVVLFIKFRKYKTAFNSGLKIWLVSGKSEMAQLFNLKFWLYLWRLGVAFSPHF